VVEATSSGSSPNACSATGPPPRPADTAPVLGYAVATAPENQAASGSFA
jgi:hypothetical protein